jgi:restriction system protein
MSQHNTHNVLAAFDVLIEEMEDALRSIHKASADALETRNYESAQTAIEHARSVMLVCEHIATLKREWRDIETAFRVHGEPEQRTPPAATVQQHTSIQTAPAIPRPRVHQELPQPVGRLIAGRIRKGLRTPEPAFYRPILQALCDLGGSAKRSDIFNELEYSMREVLKPIDYQILSSEAEQVRWQNSAQWARNLMVQQTRPEMVARTSATQEEAAKHESASACVISFKKRDPKQEQKRRARCKYVSEHKINSQSYYRFC